MGRFKQINVQEGEMRVAVIGCLLSAILVAGERTSHADTTYTFSWDHAETTWFRFSNGVWVTQQTPPDSWDADVDITEAITAFDAASNTLHTTTETVSGSMTHYNMRFTIENVTGNFNSGLETANFAITGHVNFSANLLVTEGSCRTSSFTINFSGGYVSGTDSSAATIAALSGSGNQACAGKASDINSKFGLGASGVLLHFNKFSIAPT